MGIEDRIVGHKAFEVYKANQQRQYEEEARRIIPVIKEAFVDLHQVLLQHEIPPEPIVELRSTPGKATVQASIIGIGWQYRGVIILLNGSFLCLQPYAPVRQSKVEIESVQRRTEEALARAGIELPRICADLDCGYQVLNWEKEFMPSDKSGPWGDRENRPMTVWGCGMTLRIWRSESHQPSSLRLIDDREDIIGKNLESVLADWIMKVKRAGEQ